MLVAIPDRDTQSIRRAFDFRARVSAAFQQELGDLVVSVVDGRIKRVPVRRDALLG
jgi:hypothetical protein